MFAKEFFLIFTTPAFYSAAKIVPFVALSYIFFIGYSFLGHPLFMNKKTKYLPIISGTAAIINIILNIIFIPKYGMFAAAATTALSFFIMAVLAGIFSRKISGFNMEYRRILAIFFVGIGLFLISNYLNFGIVINIILKVLILVVYPFCLLLIKFYSLKEIKHIKYYIRKYIGVIQ